MSEPIPILRVITRLNVGGPARQALLLTNALLPTYRTTLVAGRPDRSEGQLRAPEVTPRFAPLVREPSPTSDPRAFAALRGMLQRDPPLILHTHMAKAGALGRAAAFSVRRRPVTVHTFHGHVLDGYFKPTVQRTYIAIERALAARTDALIAVSDEVRADLVDLGIGEPDRIRVVPLGLDLRSHLTVREPSGALRRQIGVGADVPLVGLVGRLVPIKDPFAALRVIRRIPDAHLAIVGDGELRSAVEAEAIASGLGGRVHFSGWQLDMPSVLSDLDVVLLTSRNEGTPVALIEAAACGRVAVATHVGGVASVVEDGVTGLLIPVDDEAAIARAVEGLLSDPGRRAAMGAAARSRADRWHADRLVRDIRALYAELLDQR